MHTCCCRIYKNDYSSLSHTPITHPSHTSITHTHPSHTHTSITHIHIHHPHTHPSHTHTSITHTPIHHTHPKATHPHPTYTPIIHPIHHTHPQPTPTHRQCPVLPCQAHRRPHRAPPLKAHPGHQQTGGALFPTCTQRIPPQCGTQGYYAVWVFKSSCVFQNACGGGVAHFPV